MSRKSERYIRAIMGGNARGIGAGVVRAALRTAEPLYAGAMAARNRLYDSGYLSVHRLPRPVISIGNITTGGTGKTPLVQWLAESLREQGRHVAILSRGYRSPPGQLGDELQMLERALNTHRTPRIIMRANPNRAAAGAQLLRDGLGIDVFLLDDGFQHRRVARNLDIVLLSAVEPFGFGRVLPRGMLRERLSGLGRAHAIVLTHSDQVDSNALEATKTRIRQHNQSAPIYRAIHAQTGIRNDHAPVPILPMEELHRRRFYVFAGIGSPDVLGRQLARFGGNQAGHRWFADHHDYTPTDLESLSRDATASGADLLLTTEKDWAKIASLPRLPDGPRMWRVQMRIGFPADDESLLLDQVSRALRDGAELNAAPEK